MKRVHFTVVAGLLLGLVWLAGCQKGLYGDIEGVIVESQRGETVGDADVWLERTNIRAKTDAAGIFRFKHVPVGVYSLVCSKPNSYFRETTIPNFRVKTDSLIRTTISLEIKAELIYEDRKEPVTLSPLNPDCALFKGRYGLANDPRAALTNLVLIRRGDKKLVSKYDGLKGAVTVASPDQALEIVRLFTDLKTFFYFRERSSDNSFIEVHATEGTPGLGEIAKERGKKLGIVAPVVTSDENYYYVTRYVMSMAQNLYRIKERVGFDGDYAILDKTLIIPKMDIPIPAS